MKKLLLLCLLCTSGIMNAFIIVNQTDRELKIFKQVGKQAWTAGRKAKFAISTSLERSIGAKRRNDNDESHAILRIEGREVDMSKWSEATRKSPFTLVIVNDPMQISVSLDEDGVLAQRYAKKQATLNEEIEEVYKGLIEESSQGYKIAIKGNPEPVEKEKKEAGAEKDQALPPSYQAAIGEEFED